MRSRKTQVSAVPRQTDDELRTSCDGLLINGVDGQTAWRAHLRMQTTARQALERQVVSRASDTWDEAEEREAYRQEALAQIAEQHLVWLRAHSPQLDPPVETETWDAPEAHRPRTTRSRHSASLRWRQEGAKMGDDQATEVSREDTR